MRFGLGFDALTDFVARAYETATSTGGTLPPASIIAPKPPEEQKVLDDIQRRLVQLQADARKQNDAPLQRLAQNLEAAWTARAEGRPFEPKVLEQFEKARQELQRGADGFGEPRKLPPELERALNSLRSEPAPTQVGPTIQPDIDVEAELAAAEAEFAAENPGMSLYDDSGVIDDAKVKAFVQKYYSEEFEAPPDIDPMNRQSEEEILSQLPESQRERLLQLPATERKFLLTADPAQQIVYAQMMPDEAKFFAGLKPDQRGQYLAMTADEKVFFRTLNPDERALYLTLNPDNRALFRGISPQERKTRVVEWKQKQTKDAGRPIEQVAPELADSVLEELGMDPIRDSGIREKARALAFNYLKQTPGDRAAAETGLKKALLQDPHVLDGLLDDIEEALDAEPTASDGKAIGGKAFVDEDEAPAVADKDEDKKKTKEPPRRARVGEYAQHFARIRQTLPHLAQQMVQPGLTRQQMIEGMKNAVVVSAELAAAYPYKGRAFKASSLFGKRPIVA